MTEALQYKTNFRELCMNNIYNIKKIPYLQPCKHNETIKEAIFIEFRNLPHIEFILRNAVIKLGPSWAHTIICGNNNFDILYKICNDISDNIRIIKIDIDNLDITNYSYFLSTEEFWNLLIGEKILIHQEDSCIFENNIDDFLEYDYIGATFPTNIYSGTYVGNGGFSLRSKSIMIEVIKTISILDKKLLYNDMILPEDVYYCKVMNDSNIGKLATIEVANKFSAEYCYEPNTSPVGGHCFWYSIPNWEKYVLKHTLNFLFE